MTTAPVNLFEREHRRLDAQLRAHLIELVGVDLPSAQDRFARWWTALARHMEIEEAQLFPRIPEGARWNERLYRAEHDRIRSLAHEYAALLRQAAARVPAGHAAPRALVLDLIDRAHPLRHVLEHHHQREEMALAHELPADLQVRAWTRPPDTRPDP